MALDIRKSLIAKIHVAKKQLALTDESYRDVLRRITGKDSSGSMTHQELDNVVKEFKRLGFDGTYKPKRAGERKLAGSPQAKKIRALWITLHQLGAVHNPSEEALSAYVKRICKVDDLHWINSKDANLVINTMRSWQRRVEMGEVNGQRN